MPRDYSFGACNTCKRRKKKCDEGKPSCGACTRLQLACSYLKLTRVPPDVKRDEISRGNCPLMKVVQKLRPVVFASTAEEIIIHRVPTLVMDFCAPTYHKSRRDLSLYWQLMFQDELVQSSLVACFSVIVGVTPEPGKLQRIAYGRALKQMRLRIAGEVRTLSQILPIETALFILGFMDSAAQLPVSDLMQHWTALLTLLRYNPIDIQHLSPSESSLYLFIFETLGYHATMTIFSDRVDTIRQLFHHAHIFETLKTLNPRGDELVQNSPFLSGQYVIYNQILEITYLYRKSLHKKIQTEQLDRIDRIVDDLRTDIMRDFSTSADITDTEELQVFRQIYQMALDCLTICTTSLRETSTENLEIVDAIASHSLAQFIGIPEISMCWAAGIWPIIILASALRHDDDFQSLREHIGELVAFLPPGHVQHLEEVLRRLQQVRSSKLDHAERDWPLGLSLLKRADGIL